MIKIDKFIAGAHCDTPLQDTTNRDLSLLLQVHDELLFSVKNDRLKESAKEIKQIMEDVKKIETPIIVDLKAGKNWGEMEII